MKTKKEKLQEEIHKKMRHLPVVIITKQDVGISEIRDWEIKDVADLLEDKTLRGFERYNLEIYLKSLSENGKK